MLYCSSQYLIPVFNDKTGRKIYMVPHSCPHHSMPSTYTLLLSFTVTKKMYKRVFYTLKEKNTCSS